ncbi:MAG: ABC transporter substrate-binding protein [Propionicimonas sp.]
MALLLPACSTATPGATNQPTEQQTVVYWSEFNKGEPLQIALEQVIKDFEAENPDIKIDVNWAGRDVLTKIQAAVQGGTPVDITDHSNDRLAAALLENDLAVDLNKYLDEPAYGADSGKWRDDFTPGSIEAMSSKGSGYLIPRESYVSGLWYNGGMLKEAGLQVKATGMTWDEFMNILNTLKAAKPDVSPLGADGSIDFYNNWWFSYLAIRLAGVEAFQKAAADPTGEGWRAPEFLKAAEMVRQLTDGGYFQKGYEGSVFPAMQAQWAQGKVAMFLNGAWIPNEMAPQLSEDFELGVFAFPNLEGGKGNDVVEYWANAWAVMNTGKSTDAAVKFLKFASSPTEGGKTIADAGYPLALKDIATPPAFAGQVEILKAYSPIEQRAGLQGQTAYSADVYNFCDDPFFLGKSSPSEFIDCLATKGKEFWAKH